MTLNLILTRHAKSDWNSPTDDDFDRPLNERGRTAAARIGTWLADQGHLPDRILCSSAARTRETCKLITDKLPDLPEQVFLNTLYLAAPQDMLDLLRAQGRGATVMVIAHNPGTAAMAAMLARASHPHPAFRRFPTGFTTIITFASDRWRDVDWGMGFVADAVAPRDLA